MSRMDLGLVNLVKRKRSADLVASQPEVPVPTWTEKEAVALLAKPSEVRALPVKHRRALQAILRPALMEGVPLQDQALGVAKSLWRDQPAGPLSQDKRNSLIMVEVHRLLQLGNLPRRAWEPWSYLFTEALTFGFQRVMDTLENLNLTSQGVEGYRSVQLVETLRGDRAGTDRPAAYLVPGTTQAKEASRGLRPN